MMRFMRALAACFVLAIALVALREPAAAATAYLTLAEPNPYVGPCPVSLHFSGHIDGTPGTNVTFHFGNFVAGAWTYTSPVSAVIPAGGSLAIDSTLSVNSAHAGFQSYGALITSPVGSDSDTHGKIYFTVTCATPGPMATSTPTPTPGPTASALPLAIPVTPAPLTLLPVVALPYRADSAYLTDITPPVDQFFCFGGSSNHDGILTTLNTIAPRNDVDPHPVGYWHYQELGPNGDPCGWHADGVFRIMLRGGTQPMPGHLRGVTLVATLVGTRTNAPSCKLGALKLVTSYAVGHIPSWSSFATTAGPQWSSGSPDQVNYQIYPSAQPGPAGVLSDATIAKVFRDGGALNFMIQGTNENIDRDNLYCLLTYTDFKLLVTPG